MPTVRPRGPLLEGLRLARGLLELIWPKRQVPRHGRHEVAGDLIRAHSSPTDCILVLGWPAWPVYYWSNRRSCSPVVKMLGQVTDPNDGSRLFGAPHQSHFRPGPIADRLLASLREAAKNRPVPRLSSTTREGVSGWTRTSC